MTHPPQSKRRRFQYSLRTLRLLVTLVAIACSWYAVQMKNAAERRAAILKIEKVGGSVFYYDARTSDLIGGEPPGWFSWLRRFHGDEHMGYPALVIFEGHAITDDGLLHLKDFPNLQCLDLSGTQISDDGLVHLKGLTNLRSLDLAGTHITDAGLVHLKDLTKLEKLSLDGTRICDAGLEHLKGFENLELLYLNSEVTTEGVSKLKQALPNCKMSGTSVLQSILKEMGLGHQPSDD